MLDPQCAQCGYNLAGLSPPSGPIVCPECARVWRASDPVRTPVWLGALCFAAFIAGVAPVVWSCSFVPAENTVTEQAVAALPTVLIAFVGTGLSALMYRAACVIARRRCAVVPRKKIVRFMVIVLLVTFTVSMFVTVFWSLFMFLWQRNGGV